jgi:hypothetical protein
MAQKSLYIKLIASVSIYLGILAGAALGAYLDTIQGRKPELITIKETIEANYAPVLIESYASIYLSIIFLSALLLALSGALIASDIQNDYDLSALIGTITGGAFGFITAFLLGFIVIPPLAFGLAEEISGIDLYLGHTIRATPSMPYYMILGMLTGLALPYFVYLLIASPQEKLTPKICRHGVLRFNCRGCEHWSMVGCLLDKQDAITNKRKSEYI